MLATLSQPHAVPHNYLPTIPSPLSPRSANINGRGRTIFMSSSPTASDAESDRSRASAKQIPFSKRPVKKAPSPKHDELKERRRSMFLKKVKDEREERRFEARGEDIMRLDFVQRQRQWEAQLAREAPAIDLSDPPEGEEDEEDTYVLSGSSNAMQISAPSTQQPMLDYEADEVAQREQDELEYLIASYEPPDIDEMNSAWNPRDLDPNEFYDAEDDHSQHLYSDDDDYDALFANIVVDEGAQQQENVPPRTSNEIDDGEAMDIS